MKTGQPKRRFRFVFTAIGETSERMTLREAREALACVQDAPKEYVGGCFPSVKVHLQVKERGGKFTTVI